MSVTTPPLGTPTQRRARPPSPRPRAPQPSPERLESLFEDVCDERPDDLAVDDDEDAWTFSQLDQQANQLARYLLDRGVRPGDRVGLLLDQPVWGYLAMLGALKAGATYVPLDTGFPADRLGYVLDDADVLLLLTSSAAVEEVAGLTDILRERPTRAVCLDEETEVIGAHSPARVRDAEVGERPAGAPAYLIYTSGSTGRPKGVAIGHPAICNFVRVAARQYDLRPGMRMYQGLTLAFDFSVEETWVPWLAGAAVVPKPAGAMLVGAELHEFLARRRVTALCCVPTVLATIEHDLPELEFLLVSGEACPDDLVARWHRPGRRFLNVYGPTEATVTATWTELDPGRPVTIGTPLPSYTVAILDPDDPGRPVPWGETGEIGIAGVGLADGYVNRPEQTARAFVPDRIGLPDNPSGLIYRTGDLGRLDEHGDIEYQGRIDLQVKIRGYRIELTEIESAMLRVPGIAAAVVETHRADEADERELVGYYCLRQDTPELDPNEIDRVLRERLPPYMVPRYLQVLDAIPMTPNDKVDRANLPPPSGRRAPSGPVDGPDGQTERVLIDALAQVLGCPCDQVSVTAHIFDELGAHSLLVARFTAEVRERTGTTLSTRDVYRHPTLRGLGELLGTAAATPSGGSPTTAATAEAGTSAGWGTRVGHALTAVAQLAVMVLMAAVGAVVLDRGFRWLSAGPDWVTVAGRAGVYGGGLLLLWCVLPIAAKWLLVGRWTPREIPLWSLGYVRFWLVRLLIQTSPLVVFVGSPLQGLYLRALGARIGSDVVIASSIPPVATDLIDIGDRAVLRRDCSYTGYRAEAGRLRLGPVRVGADALVGEDTVLDVDTEIGVAGQLGRSSALLSGQRIPDYARWHGTPAEPTGADYRTLQSWRPSLVRKVCYSVLLLLGLFVVGPLSFAGLMVAATQIRAVRELLAPGIAGLDQPVFYVAIIGLTLAAMLGLLVSLAVMATVPRLLQLFVRPGRIYHLYGLRYLLHQSIGAMTNSAAFMLLLGDSSFVVPYLRALGYRLGSVIQTGSNFGTVLRHDTPLMTSFGRGTMASDGLSLAHTALSSSHFRVDPVTIGENGFLGNDITYPPEARIGDNVLLATKVLVPVDGEVRADVGLLGSPPMEIPRNQRRAASLPEGDELRAALRAKNGFNARSIGWSLLAGSFAGLLSLLILATAADLWGDLGAWAIFGAGLLEAVLLLCYGPLLERWILRRHPPVPRTCTIYDRPFWWHERLWKFNATPPLAGTPMQAWLWRLAGLRVGRRLFDDGFSAPDKSLLRIGDDAVLNAGSIVQCHSLEDGYCQTDHTTLGDRAVLGVRAFVHYGVAMARDTGVEAHSFLLKGERLAPGECWRGNPAGPAA